jgi:hypothetical protein
MPNTKAVYATLEAGFFLSTRQNAKHRSVASPARKRRQLDKIFDLALDLRLKPRAALVSG